MRIKIFTTGRTLDEAYSDADSEFQVGEPGIVELLHEANVAFAYEIESLMRKDSLDLTDEDRSLIHARVAADPADRILISHGRDTMVQTADLLTDIRGQDDRRDRFDAARSAPGERRRVQRRRCRDGGPDTPARRAQQRFETLAE
jgi:hypothetical protein